MSRLSGTIKIKRKYIREKKSKSCMDCGIQYPYYVMDFDHRDGNTKAGLVSRLCNHSWDRLIQEIKKCDVVCSNCHRIRTHNRRVSVGSSPTVEAR